MNKKIVNETNERSESKRHLFSAETQSRDKCAQSVDKKQDCLNNRKNRCSHEIGNDKQMSKNEILKNNFFKKNAAKKQTKKSLTFEKSERIFGVFYILTLTNIKGAFFSLNRVPKSRAKGTKIQGIEANSSLYPLKAVYFIKMIGGYFESAMIKNSKMSRFNIRQKGTKIQGKGTKIQGMRLNEAKVWAKGTKKSGKGTTFGGKGTKIQGMRLNEAKVWAKGTKKSGKGTTFGGALIGVGNDG